MNTIIQDLQVEYRPISSLCPAARNPRTHSQKQIQQLVESMRTFGFTNPILLDADGPRRRTAAIPQAHHRRQTHQGRSRRALRLPT